MKTFGHKSYGGAWDGMWVCNHASMTIMWIDYSFGLYFYGMLGKTQTTFFWCK